MLELQNGNKQEMIIWICENIQNNEYFRENKLTILIYRYISLQSILAEFVKQSSSRHNVCKVCNH